MFDRLLPGAIKARPYGNTQTEVTRGAEERARKRVRGREKEREREWREQTAPGGNTGKAAEPRLLALKQADKQTGRELRDFTTSQQEEAFSVTKPDVYIFSGGISTGRHEPFNLPSEE